MLTVDGSIGEGGGQVLRTTLAVALAAGEAVRIERIRTRRKRSGLRPQHLAAVRLAAAVGDADVEGAAVGSQELVFRPRGLRGGRHDVDVGTAGSVGLLLQTVAPALLTGPGPAVLTLTGGTHNPAAPPYEFLARAWAPLLERVGATVSIGLDRAGFAPAGGGRLRARLDPAAAVARLELGERGDVHEVRATALLSRLPDHIAERELRVLADALPEAGQLRARRLDADGPGNAVLVEIGCVHVTEVVAAFGRPGLPAERVAEQAVLGARRYLDAGVAVGPHLADQLLAPLALSGGGTFTTVRPTLHFTTNADVLRRLGGGRVTVDEIGDDAVRVVVGPARRATP